MPPLMQSRNWLSPLVLSLALGAISMPVIAQDKSNADLPVGTIVNFGPNLQTTAGGVCRQPEGIAIDPDGNFYLSSNSDSATTVGHVCVLDPKGNLTDIIDVPAGASGVIGLIGELWEGDQLYVLDQADNVVPHGRILKINPKTHAVTLVADGLAFPNGMAEDNKGNFYVTDSVLGRVYKFSEDAPTPVVWLEDSALLSTNPDQPVGTNDLAFDREGRTLYVSDAGNRQVFTVHVGDDGKAGPLVLFADGATLDAQLGLPSPTALFFADGMQIDVKGNLYVMANLSNEVEVFSRDGKLIHRYSGTGVNALDFNASPIFKGSKLYMTNMSATDGGVNSKVSVLQAPFPGIPLQ